MKLKDVDFDVRRILHLDESYFAKPIIPKVLWSALGDSVNEIQWKNILWRLRIILNFEPAKGAWHTASGVFDDEDSSIHITLYVSEFDAHDHLKFTLLQTIMHELIHAQQYYIDQKMYNDCTEIPAEDDWVGYLSERREVQAHSHCAFMELMEENVFPTYTLMLYDSVSPDTRRLLYKYIFRWAKKYNTSIKLLEA